MRTVRLGDIADISSGGTPSRGKPEYWGGNIPWVKTAQIQNGRISEADIDEWLTEDGLKKSSAKILPKGTILMAMYGQGKTRGQVAVLDIDASTNQACAAIQLRNGVDRSFVYQQLLYHYESIRELSNSGGQANLSLSIIGEIKLRLPELSQQAAMATEFSRWDKSAEIQGTLISSIRQRLEWFRTNYLTGKKRLSGFRASWKECRLGDMLQEHGETDSGNEEVYSVSVHEGLVNQIEHLGRSFASATTDHYNLVKPGDIVYTKSPTGDFPLGIIKQSKVDKNVIVSPLYGVFTPKTRELGVLLDCYFESPANAFNYLHPIVQRGAKNTISITNKTFLSNSLLLPTDPEEQKALAGFVELAKREIRLLEKQVEAYRRQKRGLMQKLLTGEWRVK